MEERVYEIDLVLGGRRVLAVTNLDLEADERVRRMVGELLVKGARMIIRDSGLTRREFMRIVEAEA